MNHVWQSTLFLLAVWVATLALRRNGARVRYWLWTAASIKFLVPLSAAVAVVERIEWPRTASAPGPAVAFVIDDVLAPATSVVVARSAAFDTPTEALAFAGLGWLMVAVWAIGALVVLARWWRQWQPIGAALREATPVALDASYAAGDLAVVAAPTMPEPGVVGLWRPRLVLPEGIVERLTPAQLRSLIAHERCHVRHRDNLVAAMHMVVEAIFWFHPAVWWIESRLIDERERACDEAVLASGNRPEDYAEGILEVCRQSADLRPACVAGVSGSNLRARLEAIMRHDIGSPLTRARRWALAAAIVLVVGGPIAGSALLAQSRVVVAADAPRFDTITIRPVAPFPGGRGNEFIEIEANLIRRELASSPDNGFRLNSFPTHGLIQIAYGVSRLQIDGGPEWVRSQRFAIEATAAGPARPEQTVERLQSLLADRLKLTMRRETRTVPVYELVAAPGGLKIAPLKPGDCIPMPVQWEKIDLDAPLFICGGLGRIGRMLNQTPATRPYPRWQRVIRIEFGDIDMARAILAIAGQVDRPIVDRTGFTAQFNFVLDFAPASDPTASGPSLFSALEEQVGLRLIAATAPIEMLVIESAERP
jgi:bla regulator protein BlaR1